MDEIRTVCLNVMCVCPGWDWGFFLFSFSFTAEFVLIKSKPIKVEGRVSFDGFIFSSVFLNCLPQVFS